MWHKPPPENFEIDIQVSQYPRVTYQQHIKRNWEKYNKYKKKNNNKKPTWKRKGLKIALNLKSRKLRVKLWVIVNCSVMPDSANPWTVARQAPLSIGFSRQKYWSGLPCPSPNYSTYF